MQGMWKHTQKDFRHLWSRATGCHGYSSKQRVEKESSKAIEILAWVHWPLTSLATSPTPNPLYAAVGDNDQITCMLVFVDIGWPPGWLPA